MNEESSLLPSPEIIRWSYDVFLSFRGEDVRKTFVDHLYAALEQKWINTFKDDEKLEKGKSISPDLVRAIEKSRIALIIFSKNYANSTWCLDELTKIMECKNVKGQIVLPVFYDVDPSTVRKQKSLFGDAFSDHEDCFQEEKVQKWRAALEEAANISGWDLPNTANGHEARVIENIVENIMARLGCPRHASNAGDLVGMELHMRKVNKMLGIGSGGVRFIGILGMSGVGKTTLARVIYDNFRSQFEGACFLREVRDRSAKQGLERLQEILLSEILIVKNLRINDLFEGINMLKQRLRYKKVLLVLDDVDHMDQLDTLAGGREWFGHGSRIIITTKDKHLLVKYETEKIYRMSTLDKNESLRLFKQHAFKKNPPNKEFEDLSAQVIQHTGGLPLALKVLGSFLYGKGLDEWISEVERLKQISEDEILKKLEPSFTGLNNFEQRIFLDIACFFSGKKKDSVTRILESFQFSPVIGIKVLMDKCLITLLEGRIIIHQLIQEMGWHIVRREASYDPRIYSRLWKCEDICPVLERNLGTDKIEGMLLHLTNEEEVNFGGKAFMQMTRLRFLKFRNAYVHQGPEFLPDELRWLDWHGYPSKSLPISFKGDQLVSLKLKNSRIIQLWKTSKDLRKLKYINLSHSKKLKRTPDFSITPNLERLVLEECTSLVEINFSIGNLGKLVLLNLKNCSNLKTLPKSILLVTPNLERLVLEGCTSLVEINVSIGDLGKLVLLNLKNCSKLKTLPKNILSVTPNLESLVLEGCTRLVEINFSIGNLGKLVSLNLKYCSNLKTLPKSILSVTPNLEKLVLEGCTSLVEINFSIGNLGKLVLLNLKNCSNLKTLPKSIRLEKLEILILSGCSKLKTFPEIEEKMNRLAELYLDASALSELPASVENLSGVGLINLSYCNHLESLPSSILRLKCLKTLDVSRCSKLKKLPDDLGLLVGLEELHCDHTGIQTLPSSISLLKNLKLLSFRGCNALSSQVSSLSHGQKSMGVNFQNLSGLCSLIMLDLSDCNISDGGVLSNLRFLPSLKELNLDGNNFSNIPAASISRFTRLEVLALAGCRMLESLLELPPSIKEIYADECTSLMSIDELTKYPMLRKISFTKCHQLVKNERHASMVDSLLKLMVKGLSMNARFSAYVPGVEIPEWFTYRNSESESISVALPKNWYTPTFRGIIVCVVFDMMTPFILWESAWDDCSFDVPTIRTIRGVKTFQSLELVFSFRTHNGEAMFARFFGAIGSEKPVGLGNTLLVYLPREYNHSWLFKDGQIHNSTELRIGVGRKVAVAKGFGVRLVYENSTGIKEGQN